MNEYKMAFANLFTRLSAVDEGVQSTVQPAFTHRNESGTRGSARKRKTQGEQPGSSRKNQCHQVQTTPAYNTCIDDNAKAICHHMQSTYNEHASFSFTKEGINSHSDRAVHNNRHCSGQNYKTKNNCNVNKQQQQENKTKGQKYQHQREDRRKPANRDGKPMSRKGGRGGNHKGAKQNFKVNPTRVITQEFKDHNALLVDGRLLCRHFLWGRCIKAEDCQLEHVQGYNDLIKAVCKFYIQGFCTKGKNCPFMHKSFPCKFFHRNGKCSQGANCRFSHEPLNDITKQLLDEALKRENDLCELANKAEQESSEQPANIDESETIEANSTPDVLQPLRPNFYSSTDTNAEKETLLSQTEEVADITYKAIPPHVSDGAQPHSSPSTSCNHEEPVCYSVEPMLGPQLSRPFLSFFTTPGSQESTCLSAPQTTSDATFSFAKHSERPYSVDAVLRSCKSVENSNFNQTPSPPAVKTTSYTPQTNSDSEEITDPLLSSQHQTGKVSINTRKLWPQFPRPLPSFFTTPVSQESRSLSAPQTTSDANLGSANNTEVPYSVEAVLRSCKSVENSTFTLTTDPLLSSQRQNEKVSLKARDKVSQEKMFKSLPSLRVHSRLISSTYPRFSLTTGDHKKHSGDMSESLKSTQRAPQLELAEKSVSSKSKSYMKESTHQPADITYSVRHKSQTCHPEHPTKLKPQLSGLTSDSQSSIKPSSTALSFTEFKGRAAFPVEPVASSIKTSKIANSAIHHFAAKQLTEIHQPSKKTQPGLKLGTQQHYSTKITTECSSKTANRIDPSIGCNEAQERPFLSLFASPITDSVTPAPESVTGPQDFIQSLQSADFPSKDRHVEPDKAPASPFLSLFASPLSETTAAFPCFPSEAHYSRTPPYSQVEDAFHLFKPSASSSESPTHKQISPKLSPSPKYENESVKQQVNPVCSLVYDPFSEMPTKLYPPTTQAQQQPPNTVSPRASTANSVLKTLFLCLSPYQADREQQDSIQMSVPSESEMTEKSSLGCIFVKQQRKRKNKGKRKK